MSHKIKLELFRLKIKNKKTSDRVSIRELFRKKLGLYDQKQRTNHDIFVLIYKDLIKVIDLDGFITNSKKKKAFGLAGKYNKNKKWESAISPPEGEHTIWGILEGGTNERKRRYAPLVNKKEGKDITVKEVVGDQYYFLLYLPLNSTEIILITQGYTDVKISDAVRAFFVDYFRFENEFICEPEILVPDELKKDIQENSYIKSIKFSRGWFMKEIEEIDRENFEFQVNIEIIDKSKEKSPLKQGKLQELLAAFRKSTFKLLTGQETELRTFKASAKANNGKKDIALDIDDENNIKPSFIIEDGTIIIVDGVPEWGEMHKYCIDLLERIIEQSGPQDAVQPL